MSGQLKNWKLVREEVLTTILITEPSILNDKSMQFKFGRASNCSIVFKHGIIAIDRDDLLVLFLRKSMPKDPAVRLIDALTQHCIKQKINLAVEPIDGNGERVDTNGCMVIRV